MTEHFPLMIPGAPAKAGVLKVTAPYDGALIAEVETGDENHLEQALTNAYALFRDRNSWLSLHERVAILEKTAHLMTEDSDMLAVEAAREGGKPLPDSQVEVARAIDGVRLCIEHIRSDHGDVIPMGGTASSAHRAAFTQKEPIGVVVAVSAFNHPLNLIVHQVAAAVAAGCPVVVKPADDTPLSCFRFVKLLHKAGLPEEWCQPFMPANLSIAEKLVTDSRVGFFSFIGSARVGWMLRSKLAPGTRCALEHGGAAPVVLAEDFDSESALNAIAKGGFYHAGQVCVSVQRVYAPRKKAHAFAEALAGRASKLKIGDPTLAETEVGPLIRHAEVKRVHEWVEEAVAEGAERLCGGEPITDSCYPCTVLLNPPDEAKVSQLEIFGPVVCVYAYDDIDDAFRRANSLPVAFQAAVFTRDLDVAMHAYKHLDASAVMVNDHTAFRIDGMPFAGIRQSGLGIGGIPYTIEDMQIEKMLVLHSPGL
ncbi:MAG: aldehyde dehydrogenase family protein [Gammaproteobacteria bacterium]|nr:aldehyde dehydrogenase family protein [Gammaproteobacteria bacterium]